jgi:beta-glucosidase
MHVRPAALRKRFPSASRTSRQRTTFQGTDACVAYAESVYVGYRFFASTGRPVLFPFGHGLSYTRFEYSDLDLRQSGELVTASFTLRNAGEHRGAEVAQLYVRDLESTVFRPDRELKGFCRVELAPGESSRLTIELDRRSFSYWDPGHHRPVAETGDFEILVGASSADVRLSRTIRYETDAAPSAESCHLRERVPAYDNPGTDVFHDLSPDGPFATLLGRTIPHAGAMSSPTFTRNSTVEDISETFIGRTLRYAANRMARRAIRGSGDRKSAAMMEAAIGEMPLRNLTGMTGGAITPKMVDGLVLMVNGRFFPGVYQLLTGRRTPR